MFNERISSEKANPNIIDSEMDLVVPSGMNVLINDISASPTWINQCAELLKPDLIVFKPDGLSRILEMSMVKLGESLAGQRIAVLYPKNGGLKVRDTLRINSTLLSCKIDEFEVNSQRFEPNTAPFVEPPKEFVERVKECSYDCIVIVDDVIVSGKTMDAIRKATYLETDVIDSLNYNPSTRFGWSDIRRTRIPLKWYGCSWMIARRKEQSITLEGFEKIQSGLCYKGETGQPPVNSISTWTNDRIKGQTILESYAKKYARDPEKFIRFIKNTKGGEK